MRQPPRSHRTDGICPCTGRCLSSVGPELAEAVYYFGLVRVCTARSRYVSLPARGPGQAGQALIRQADITPVALVFGRERTGLSNEELAQCHGAVHIPAVAGFSSLNLAAAVQVLSYEVRLAMLNRDGDEPLAAVRSDACDSDEPDRSEERRVGQECVSTGRSR